MSKKVAVLPGDGVGPEIVSSAVAVINTLTSDVELINGDAGYECFRRTGSSLPRLTMDLIDECDAVLVGSIKESDNDKLYRNPLLDIKKRLDLFAEVRTVRKIVPDLGAIDDIDAVFIKENNDGIFNLSEIEELNGAILTKRVSYSGSRRLCQYAKEMMSGQGHEHITCVHKKDLYKVTDGLFLDTFYKTMDGSPFKYDDMKADEMASYIMYEPRNIDVIISVSPYCDILSEEAGALAGGTHLIPVSHIGDRKGLFKPLHGPLQSMAGLNVVNPTASLMCASNMLRFLGYDSESDKLNESIRSAYKRGHRTADVGGNSSTMDFTMQVVKICDEGQ